MHCLNQGGRAYRSVIGAVLILLVLAQGRAPAMQVEVVELGVACRSHYLQSYQYLSDGTVALVSYAHRGAQLLIADPDTGDIEHHDLPMGNASWHLVASPETENLLWITTLTPGSLLCFDRAEGRFTHVVQLPEGTTPNHTCRLDFDTEGRIYVGTVPSCKLFRYDPATRELEDLGVMSEANQYVRDVIVGPTGLVYALCGCEESTVVVYDPADGSTRAITPQDLRVPGVPMFTRVGDIAFVNVIYPNRVFAYDLKTAQYLYEIPGTGGGPQVAVSATTEPDIVRISAGEETRVFRATTGEELSIPPPPHTLVPKTRSGKSYRLSPGMEGHRDGLGYLVTDPQTGDSDFHTFPPSGNGQRVVSLFCTSDGTLYGSPELCKTLFRLRPGAQATESLGVACKEFPSGQFYGLCEWNEQLYMAGYHGATVSVYDPSVPFDVDAGNPRLILEIGEQQHRPEGGMIVGPERKLYIGTQPEYGYKGGALCVFDPVTETVEVHRNIVPEQSVESLATDGTRYIFAGTSIVGGGLVKAHGARAHFLVWDCDEGRVVFDEEVDDDDIRSIATSGDATRVYVPVGKEVRIFDVAQMAFTGRVAGSLPGKVNFCSGMTGNDGHACFCAGGSLVRVDPATDALTVVHAFPSMCTGLAQAPDGSIFTSTAGLLYKVNIKEDEG